MCRRAVFSVLIVSLLGLLSSASAAILQCDAGTGALQSGWTQAYAGLNSNVAGSGIDVTLATGQPGAIEPRNTGGSGDLADVETDFYFANDERESPGSDFILTLSNLTPGAAYQLLSYHSRTDEGDTTIPNVTVTGATNVTVPASIVQTHAIMDNPAEILFTAGAGDVVIRYQGPDGGCAGCQAFFNGFELYISSPTVGFESASSGAIETISPAQIGVVLSNPEPGETYTVDYAATGGTAEANGVDYTLEPNTFTFEPGETTKTVNIEIVDDGLTEEDETIILELSNPTGLDVVLGIAQHTYTISDLRPKVSFDSASSTGLESATPVMIAVKLSHASDETVTVDYAATGTATGGGVDYTLLGDGTLTFEPLDVTQYIGIDIIDDSLEEGDETIVLSLSDPCNATLGTTVQHTYSILDNEQGFVWDGLVWYYSDTPNPLYESEDGEFVWEPEKDEQFITRLPDQSLSQVGDIVELTYWWMTDGDHDCPDCRACPGCFDDDITCLAGTSDMRAGFFQADGEYIVGDGFDVYGSSIFTGYKGYGWRFGPNMEAEPTYWKDCTGEVHKTGQFQKKAASLSNLLSTNDGLRGVLPGFELPPGEWSLWTISLERLSSSSVELSITLNDRTETYVDDSAADQPSKIDVFAVTMRNGRPYDILSFGPICRQPPADIDQDGLVEWDDVRLVGESWLDRCRVDDWCGGRDINQDSRVDLLDFAILGADWLQECSTLSAW